MTEEEQIANEEYLLSLMDENTKSIYVNVCDELKKTLNTDKIYTDTVIDEGTATNLCIAEGIEIYSDDFKKALNTPLAITKYIQLWLNDKELSNKITEHLNKILPLDKIEYTLYNDFKREITFTRKLDINSEEKPQNLQVRYNFIDDKPVYTILGSSWGWDLDDSLLLTILTGKKQSIVEAPKKTFTPAAPMVLQYNGVKVTLESC